MVKEVDNGVYYDPDATPDRLRPLRIGAPTNFVAEPLIRGLDDQKSVSLETTPARMVPAGFEAGRYDCALLNAMDCLHHKFNRIIPGIGVCCRGRSDTDFLFLGAEPARATRLAVDADSQGVIDLARVILAEKFDIIPAFTTVEPDSFIPEEHDGLLVSGNTTYDYGNRYAARLDIGELWYELTGLPLPLMMWAAQFRAPYKQLRLRLARARQQGLADLDAIAAEVEAKHGVPDGAARTCFNECICYTLGGEELDGLRELIALAMKHGLCEPDTSFELC